MAKSPEPADALATVDLDPLAAAPTPPQGTFRQAPLSAASVSSEQLPYKSWERYRIEAFLGAGGCFHGSVKSLPLRVALMD